MASHLMRRVLGAVALVALCAAPLWGQGYGGPVATGNGQLMVGESSNGNLPGIVYLYGSEGGTWVETGRLMMGDEVGPPDGYGRALAANDEVLLVGAPSASEGQGIVIAYENRGGTWTEVGRLSPEGAAGFGARVSMSGDVALISAPNSADGAGAAYAFRRGADGAWSQVSSVTAPDGAGLGFGQALVLDGDHALIATAVGRNQPGEVYAFTMNATGGFESAGRLDASETAPVGYGSAVDLSGGTALVGAPGVADRTGAVYVFRMDEGEWSPAGSLTPFHAQRRAQFGAAVGHDGESTWIGAPGDNGGAGAVYNYQMDGNGGWSGVSKLTADDAPGFGSSVALGGSVAMGSGVAVVGAGNVDSRAGGAVLMAGAGSDWSAEALVKGDHRNFPAMMGEEIECSDGEIGGFECSNVNVASFLPISAIGGARGTMVNDIWGWTDPVTAREYAIVGRSDGTSFVDVTDPYNPRYLGNLPMTEGSRASVWRDMKVYEDHAYIVADAAGAHGMQVFDLTRLRDVTGDPELFDVDFLYTEINSAHNIVINEDTGFGYAVGSSGGGTTCGGGLHMIALENPKNPVFDGCFFDVTTGRSKTGYSHDAQCVVYHGPDEEHQGKEICLGSNETALSIADVTDKENPEAISVVTYPNVAYAHQGWLTEDHRYFYMNDEGDEPSGLVEGTRTLVWDVMDLDDPVLVKEHIAETSSTDHNLYVLGDRMYQSNYDSGLRVLDVSDPANPVEVGFFDTTPYGGGGSWSNYPYFKSGMIIATSMGEGLFVLKSVGQRNLIP